MHINSTFLFIAEKNITNVKNLFLFIYPETFQFFQFMLRKKASGFKDKWNLFYTKLKMTDVFQVYAVLGVRQEFGSEGRESRLERERRE